MLETKPPDKPKPLTSPLTLKYEPLIVGLLIVKIVVPLYATVKDVLLKLKVNSNHVPPAGAGVYVCVKLDTPPFPIILVHGAIPISLKPERVSTRII